MNDLYLEITGHFDGADKARKNVKDVKFTRRDSKEKPNLNLSLSMSKRQRGRGNQLSSPLRGERALNSSGAVRAHASFIRVRPHTGLPR